MRKLATGIALAALLALLLPGIASAQFRVVVNTGASNTKIKLGDKTKTTYVNVEMGAASLTIYVPKASGCKVSGEMILMKKELSGFDKKGSDYYITNNYEESPNKILIDIDGGVSSFKVRRY